MRIFASVGTQNFQFNRFFKMLEEACSQLHDVDVFAQTGHSTYIPANFRTTKFLEPSRFEYEIKNADVVVSHAGVGTIIKAISMDKKVIVIPRCKMYSEHVDDHQIEIANSFAEMHFIKVADNSEQLREFIASYNDIELAKYVSGRNNFLSIINTYLEKNC